MLVKSQERILFYFFNYKTKNWSVFFLLMFSFNLFLLLHTNIFQNKMISNIIQRKFDCIFCVLVKDSFHQILSTIIYMDFELGGLYNNNNIISFFVSFRSRLKYFNCPDFSFVNRWYLHLNSNRCFWRHYTCVRIIFESLWYINL